MAMTVIADALVFHAALSEAEMIVQDQHLGMDRAVREPRTFRQRGAFSPSPIIDEWERILEVNYWPIFHTASAIVKTLPTQLASTILGLLWETAEQLVVGGVTRSHDLTGVVFQRLIADRKFLATYYTMPSGAALLAGLAPPLATPLMKGMWSDPAAICSLRIGDFACGTGTLLSTAYQRIGLLHELHGGNPKELHRHMMRQGLVGFDPRHHQAVREASRRRALACFLEGATLKSCLPPSLHRFLGDRRGIRRAKQECSNGEEGSRVP
jgi:hypothetical protein